MKKEIIRNKEFFMCEACDMYYLDKEIAQKCEDFCNRYHACDTELIKHAVNPEDNVL